MRGNSNSHAYSYPDGHANGYSDGYTNSYGNRNCYANSNSDTYCYCYCYCHAYYQPDADIHTEVHSSAKTAPDAASSPDAALECNRDR